MISLVGAVQHYAWGSETAIPAALGIDPDGRPWAEVWWGTHPGGVTMASLSDDRSAPLADVRHWILEGGPGSRIEHIPIAVN